MDNLLVGWFEMPRESGAFLFLCHASGDVVMLTIGSI